MDSTELQRIPRVSVKALQAQSHPTDVWELASENVTLSMCRHNVSVLQLPGLCGFGAGKRKSRKMRSLIAQCASQDHAHFS